MLLVNLVAAYASACLLVSRWRSDPREIAVFGSIPFGVALVLVTETLGALHLLTRSAIALAWLGVISVFVTGYLLVKRSGASVNGRAVNKTEAERPLGWMWSLLLLGGVGLVVLVGISAFLAAPNTWDAMQYHLPRVVEWATFRSVSFYPTQDYQQLIAPPFAEYAMLQAFLLYGGDAVVSLVQWVSWIGCTLGASLLAKYLGAAARGQAMSAVLTLALPGAVLTASGPKNDCVVAFWIVSTVCLLFVYGRRPTPVAAIVLGASIGLGLLTKGTAYVYVPVLILGAFLSWPREIKIRALRHAVFIGLCALSLNAPQYARNLQLSGSVLGFPYPDNDGRKPWRNGEVSLRRTTENVVRELVSHINLRTPDSNARFNARVRVAMTKMGLEPDDPATTWVGDKFFIFPYLRNEIHAGSPIQIGLFIACLGVMLLVWDKYPRSHLLFALSIVGAFLFFCMLLRYQEGIVRLHLPLLILSSATIALVIGRNLPPLAEAAIAGLVLLLALPNAVLNDLRPLVHRAGGTNPGILRTPRERVYFYDFHQAAADSYIAATHAVQVSGCHTVGIDATQEHFEYPLFGLMHAGTNGLRVVYSGVTNRTIMYQKPESPRECAVICPACAGVAAKLAQYSRISNGPLVFGDVAVFISGKQ